MRICITCIFFLTAFGFTTACFSQECKVAKDPFTGERIVSSEDEYNNVRFENKKDAIKFSLIFTSIGQTNEVYEAGTEFLMKFEGGEIISLKTISGSAPLVRSVPMPNSGTVIVTDHVFEFNLNKDQLNKLAATKLIFIRYPDTKGGNADLDLTSKKQGKTYSKYIVEGAQCILKNL